MLVDYLKNFVLLVVGLGPSGVGYLDSHTFGLDK